MPETNEDIKVGIVSTFDATGIDQADKAISQLKKQLSSFGEAFQLGKIINQMNQLTNMYKAAGLQVDAATGQLKNSTGTLLTVGQAAEQVANSMGKVAQKATETKALSAFMTQFRKGGSDADKFRAQLGQAELALRTLKSTATGKIGFEFRDINTGQIVSAATAMKRVEEASITVRDRIRQLKAEFANTTYIEKFKQDMLSIGIIVDEIKTKTGTVQLRFTTNTGDIISAKDAMTKLKVATDQARLAQDKLVTSQKIMRSVMQGVSSVLRQMQNAFLGIGLSMLFIGMQIKRTAETIAKSVMDTYMKIVEGGTFASRGIFALGGAFTFLKFVVGDAIAEALLPFIPAILDIVDALADWIDENPELVSTIILGAIALGTFMMIVGQLIIPLGILTNALAVLINMLLAGQLQAGLAAAGEALAALAAPEVFIPLLAILAIVIIAVLAVIAAIITLKEAWDHNWNGFREVVASVIKKITSFLADWFTEIYKMWKSVFAKNLPEVINQFFNFFRNLWNGNFDQALANLGIFVVNVIAIFGKILSGGLYIFSKLFTTIAGIYVDFSQWLWSTSQKLNVRLEGLFRALIAALIRLLASFGTSFVDIMKSVTINFGKGLETMYSKFVSFVNSIITEYNKIPGLPDIGKITKTTIDITSNVGATFDKFKTTVTQLGETLATGITMKPEELKTRDIAIDKAAKTMGDQLRSLISGLDTLINNTIGADVINPIIDKATAMVTDKIKELTGTTQTMTEQQIKTEQEALKLQAEMLNVQYQALKAQLAVKAITPEQYQAQFTALNTMAQTLSKRWDDLAKIVESGAYEKDYYSGSDLEKLANGYLEGVDSLRKFADSLNENTQAAETSAGAVNTFSEGMAKLPLAYVSAIAKIFTGGDANAIATEKNTLALEETGKINVDNANTMASIIDMMNTMMSGGTVPTMATTTAGGTTTTNNNTTTTNTQVTVDMSGITATNGSVVIPQDQLQRIIQQAVQNSMKAWEENFKQGMNSYGV